MNDYQYGLLLGWLTGGGVGIVLGLVAGLAWHVRRILHEPTP